MIIPSLKESLRPRQVPRGHSLSPRLGGNEGLGCSRD